MKIILADDQPEVRSALRLLLEQCTGLIPVSEASDADGLLDQARRLHPDLILLDWELPGGVSTSDNPPQAGLLADLRRLAPQVKVVALSGRPEARAQALDAQVYAFVSKGEPPEQLLEILSGLGLRKNPTT